MAYDRYAAALYGYCHWMLHDSAAAAGALKDTFVIAAATLSNLSEPSKLRPWLFALARNECRRRIRPAVSSPREETDADVSRPMRPMSWPLPVWRPTRRAVPRGRPPADAGGWPVRRDGAVPGGRQRPLRPMPSDATVQFRRGPLAMPLMTCPMRLCSSGRSPAPLRPIVLRRDCAVPGGRPAPAAADDCRCDGAVPRRSSRWPMPADATCSSCGR